MAETARAGNPLSRNQLQTRFRLPRGEADEIWRKFQIPVREVAPVLEDTPAGVPPESTPAPAGASPNGKVRHG